MLGMIRMKKKNYDKYILLLSFLLPFMDIYRSTVGNKFQLFGFSFVELINFLFTFILLILLFLKSKQDNKKIFSKKTIPIIIVYGIYILLHVLHILSFKGFIYINENISMIVELYYIVRAYILPLIVLFVYMKSNLKTIDIMATLSKISLIFSLIIVISNVFKFSYVGYSSNYEGNVTIIGNIFSWFNGININDVDLYTSKGLFYSTNQLSAILGSLLFISAFYTLLKNDCKYYLSFLIKLIAALMLSTKTAFFAITFSILSIFVYAMIEYIFNKKKVLKIRCLFFVLEFCFILFLFSYSPVKYKMQGYITNINNNTDNDVSSVNSECDYLIDELSDKYNLSLDVILKKENIDNSEKEYLSLCIEKCPQKFSVPETYVEFYPVKENFNFWFDTIKQDTSFLTNYRGFKKSMYEDILNKHDDKIDKWLGIGYSSNFPYLERDFIGQEVWLGKIGMFLVTIPLVAIFAFSLVSLLIHFKKKINIFTCSFLLASAYMILSSILAGHVFGIFLTTSILSLLLVGLYNEVKRNQINIKDNKISFLLLHLGYGGIESATINTANSLCDDYDIEIMSFYKLSKTQANKLNDKIKVKYLYDDGPNKEEFLDVFHNHKIFSILKEGIKSVSILTKKKIRVINYIKNCDSKYIVSTRYDFSALLSKYGNDNSVKIAQEHHYHNNNKRYINILKNKYYNIDFLFALTKTLEKDYKKFLIKNKHTKVVLVPNMLYYIPSKQSKLDKKNIITISRLDYGKRNDDIIKAFSKIKENDWKLYIIGDGKEFNNLNKLINDLNMNDRIILTGYKNKEEIEKYMLKSSLFLMASETEGLPMVLLEAMSYGIPCIAYEVASGVNDIIDNNKNGYIIKNRNEEEYIEKIEKVINDSKLRNELGIEAKNKANEFSKEKIVNIWEKILK